MDRDPQKIVTGLEATTRVHPSRQHIPVTKEELLSARAASTDSGPHADIDQVMGNVFQHLIRDPERAQKYQRFLFRSFNIAKAWSAFHLPNSEVRFRAFLLTYSQQRLFDDIIDGDTPRKIDARDRVAYAAERMAKLDSGDFDSGDPIDAFAMKILTDIEILDPAYVDQAKRRLGQIMQSIAFDGERIRAWEESGTWQFSSREDLQKHFFNLDIEGVIGMSLFLFGYEDSQSNRALLTPLGQAVRVSYNIRDFIADLEAGLCNIPKEDAEELHITEGDLRAAVKAREKNKQYPDNVKEWLRRESLRGQALLLSHRELTLSALELQERFADSSPMRAAAYRSVAAPPLFNLVYASGARKIFKKTVDGLSK